MRLVDLFPAARDTVVDPRAGFRRMRTLNLSRDELWVALGAVTLLGVLMAELMLRMLIGGELQPMFTFGTQPLVTALIQLGVLAVLVLAVHWGGRMLGGKGTMSDAILAVVWLQFIMALLQAAQLIAVVILPPIAGLLGIAGLGLFFWLLTGFVAELHGFRSRGKVFLGVLLALIAVAVALVFILTLIGVTLPGMPDV